MSQAGGEKELILGNKQLISLFFVVVALCGVFFAMGYMVRGNAIKGSVATGGDAGTSVAPGSDAVKRQQPEPPAETASAETSPPSDTPVETHPAQDTAAPVDAAGDAPTKVEPPKLEPMKAQTARLAVAALESGASYVQVGALPRADAESTARTLREQRLPALIAPSSKEGLFRVLVGPYHSTTDVADAKAKLKTLSFGDTRVLKQ